MQVALFSTYRVSKKEPLAEVLSKVYAAFTGSGAAPAVHFTFSDAPIPGFVSSIDRVLKRFPELAPFEANVPMAPNSPAVRSLSNRLGPAGEVPFERLLDIASGVPRSFPFHNAQLWLSREDFGEPTTLPTGPVAPGVILGDAWWVNGRSRSLSSYVIVDGDPAGKTLPALPGSVAHVLDACGKPQKTTQFPLSDEPARTLARPEPRIAEAVAALLRDYHSRLPAIIAAANMPHDLPPRAELSPATLSQVTGPRKPVLTRVFGPLRYSCTAGSGTFSLQRKTANNLAVEVYLDVGTWSKSVLGFYKVTGMGFTASLPLAVSPRSTDRQYPLGDAHQWQQIVENLAALTAEYDRTFIADIEAAAGGAPEWFAPAS